MSASEKIDPLKYRHIAVIKFNSRFPIDMLRYDHCMPRSESDANEIQRSFDGDYGPKQVTVIKYHWDKDWNGAWTPGRWRSFGCEISQSV